MTQSISAHWPDEKTAGWTNGRTVILWRGGALLCADLCPEESLLVHTKSTSLIQPGRIVRRALQIGID